MNTDIEIPGELIDKIDFIHRTMDSAHGHFKDPLERLRVELPFHRRLISLAEQLHTLEGRV